MKLEISYAALKVIVGPTGPLNLPLQWSRVYWQLREDGHYNFWLGMAGGFIAFGTITSDTEKTDFNNGGEKVAANEVTSTGVEDGFAIAAHNPLAVL